MNGTYQHPMHARMNPNGNVTTARDRANAIDPPSSPLGAQQLQSLRRVERSLAAGRQLRRWWESAARHRQFQRQFRLVQTFNAPDESFGFTDTPVVDGQPMRIMGSAVNEFFDQPKSSDVQQWQRNSANSCFAT